ncbi:hypothetical protein BU24DRAFT_422769 [Aaosphaeria arxii CBS 175.79]|uniref:Uncharacterized protein n=1 Tax=Aaosphaeria arxii CBS 175.79 TaxID=1450172 RepID=A0A6A5XUP0_9PLEO|nr:uncharacterized protein BU24DRAFT_422769 [Aaosphaeria arxii CBS 175.79]KAF2016431.1 hypothetical protein BU24DRAFT_422769 [Aaosphaeria arxii CBS 175.79]
MADVKAERHAASPRRSRSGITSAGTTVRNEEKGSPDEHARARVPRGCIIVSFVIVGVGLFRFRRRRIFF